MTNGNDGAFGKKERMGSAYMGDITVRTYGDGLTKREYFAAMAMQGFCSAQGFESGYSLAYLNCDTAEPRFPEKNYTLYATAAVKVADALIAALNKEAE